MRLLLAIFLLLSFSMQAQELSYYLPDSVKYNPAVPVPEAVIGHKVGEWHVTHDRLVNYMKAIAASSPDRVKIQFTGTTYETRPQLILIITSPKNHSNLEQIRNQHVKLTDPEVSASLDINAMPAVIWMGFSIHGNEPSGANASLLSAYHLAAAQGKQIEDLLENTVILLDPSFNPDGLNRFATWANMHKGKNLITDPNSREFNEVWPGGRFNHYWFDLNRDWLPAVHVESQNRLKVFHNWKPNILTDHHEMGSNSTFFFQPGVPSRVNPLTPARNQELTGKIGEFHAQYLDRIGSLYYTKEGYDDFYYGKGSTYPDVNGAIGILFEQASSRGHAQETQNGLLTFPFTIRNQFITTLSTLEAGRVLRKDLLNYQREFYRSVANEAAAAAVKGYVFGDPSDKTKSAIFVEMLLRHKIDVYCLKSNVTVDNKTFQSGGSYIVPAAQQQHRLIRGIFDRTLEYKDSLFYDITAWTMPLAFGLSNATLNAKVFNTSLLGSKVDSIAMPVGKLTGGTSVYGYAFEWNEFYAPRALYQLQEAGILARVTSNPFETTVNGQSKRFDYGTITIPVQLQPLEKTKLEQLVRDIAVQNGIEIFALSSGSAASGSDFGSSKNVILQKQKIMLLSGAGVSPTDAGEMWHMFDQRFNIPVSMVEIDVFNRIDLSKYTTIIMVSGNYGGMNNEKLRGWVQAGGNLILCEDAISWAARQGLTSVSFKSSQSSDSVKVLSYVDREFNEGSKRMSGSIFRAEIDRTHPLAYGYSENYVDLFKSNSIFPKANKNPYSVPYRYGASPLQSGYITTANYAMVKNSAAVLANALGRGMVTSIADDPVFRAFWLGGTKLLMNAVFFGNTINSSSAQNTEE